MKPVKRQIVLGALILALGAAVYLNWQFTDATIINDVNASTENQDKPSDQNLGIAQLVNSNYIETVTDIAPQNTNKPQPDDKLAKARIDRQTSRDEALQILNKILQDEKSDAQAKKSAIDSSAIIAQNMIKETTAENLIKAKGINDIIVYINDDLCTVVATKAEENLLIIQDIIVKQTGFSIDKIQIIST